jgi:hypothetical protein
MDLQLTELSNVIRNTNFGSLSNGIVTDTGETVTNVEIVADKPDSGIILSTNFSNVTVSGSYEDQFNDRGEYVTRGSSNKIEEPTIFTKLNELPPNEDLYEFIQDPKPQEVITYTVTITYNYQEVGPPVVNQTDLIFVDSFTHTVINDHTSGYNVVRNYY